MISSQQVVVQFPGGLPLGFRLSAGRENRNLFVVSKIRPLSKADQAGLSVGDIVLTINGICCEGLSHMAVTALTDDNDTLSLLVLRGSNASAEAKSAFANLGQSVRRLTEQEINELVRNQSIHNWSSISSRRQSTGGIAMLNRNNVNNHNAFRLQDPPFGRTKQTKSNAAIDPPTYREVMDHDDRYVIQQSRPVSHKTRGNSLQRKETETKANVDERVENVYKKRHIIPQRFKNMSLENDIQVSESEDMELKQEILTEKYQANLQKFENRTLQNDARTEEANHPRTEEGSNQSTSANRPYFEMNPHMINRQGRSRSEIPSGPEQPKFQSKLEFTFAANDDMKQKTAIQVKNKISSRRFSLSLPRNISTSQPSATYSNFPNHPKEQTLNNNRSPETAGFAGGSVIRESDKSRIFVGNQTKLDEDAQHKKQILNRWSNQFNAGDQAFKRGDSGNTNRFQSPDGSRNQLPIQSPDGSRNQLPIQSPDGSRNKLPIQSPEGSRNQFPIQSPERSRNQLPIQSPEGSRNRLPIQSPEGNRNRLQIQSPDGGRNQEFRNTPDSGVKNLKFWQFMQTGQVNNSERDKSPATFSDSGTNRSDDQDQPPISINNGRINNSNGPNQQPMSFNNGRINNSKGPIQQPMSFNNGRINNSNEPNQQPMSFNNGRINNSNGPNQQPMSFNNGRINNSNGPNQQPMSFNNGRINNSNGPNQSYNNNNSYRRSDQFPIQNQNANNNHQENSKVNSFGNTEMEQTGQAENWNRGRQRMRSTSLLVQNLNTPTATTMDRKTTNYSIQLGTSQDSGSKNRMGENKTDMRQINWQGEPQRTWQNDPWKTWQDEQNDRDFRSRSRQIKQTPNFLQQNIQNDDILQNQGASREPQQHQVQNNIQSNATRKQFQYNNQSNQTRQPFQYNNQSNQMRQPFQYNNQSNQTRQQFQNYNQSNQTRQTNSSLIDQWRPLNSGNPANERERFRQRNMQEYDYCQTEKDTSYLSPARTKIQLRCSSVPPQDLERSSPICDFQIGNTRGYNPTQFRPVQFQMPRESSTTWPNSQDQPSPAFTDL